MRDNPDRLREGDPRCPGCFLLPEFCCCHAIPSVANQIELLIIRHFRETLKSSNSARLAFRALQRCRMIGYGAPRQAFEPGPQDWKGSWLLFPQQLDHYGHPDPKGPPVHDLAEGLPDPLPRRLVVLDGTWGQTRRMSHRIAPVARLPRLAVPPLQRARVRKPPNADNLATLEAIGWAYYHLEGPAVGEPLLDLFDRFVAAHRNQCHKP